MIKRLSLTLSYQDDLEQFIKREHSDVIDFRILSKSLDARKSNLGRVPKVHYTLEVKTDESESFAKEENDFPQLGPMKNRPIIIGAGPAGLFCALRFADYGIPTLIIERGDQAHSRMKHISKYWRRGELDPDNNVCFGEGGAGLFSDGKLITRIKSPYVKYVMQKFVDFGAPADTAYVSNPHLGSNKIRQLIGKMTNFLISKNHDILYNSPVSELIFASEDKAKVIGVRLSSGKEYFSDHVILATGHSATKMYHHLKDKNVAMKAKGFAVGVRIEHPRSYIDGLQYGDFAGLELGAARYRLSWEDPTTKKGSYSFCMCPGGYVLSSGTDSDGIVVNGMSNYARNSRWSNAALVVSVEADKDFSTADVLSGLKYQQSIEQLAFQKSQELASGKEVPSQTIRDFLNNSLKDDLPKTSCPSGLVKTNLRDILPMSVSAHLTNALGEFDRKMKGFVTDKGQLMAPETRTSAPVTILRHKETLESENTKGLYPCGEGAGYAGGITSAGVDGIKVAMSIIGELL
jgi:uncharacterized FAD-dependent dehydrogenase